ncbi:MAG TPA: hypothetical protein VHZ24_12340 [Pirellulales bacterium]|nr:hypothetical protein [Pirellulales bacterium]
MTTTNLHAEMVRIALTEPTGVVREGPPRNLLPWADPCVSRMMEDHRLQAALQDSLAFLKGTRDVR